MKVIELLDPILEAQKPARSLELNDPELIKAVGHARAYHDQADFVHRQCL